MITRLGIVSLVALWVASTSATAWAQFDYGGRTATSGITVSGIGTVKGMPDKAKIEIHIQGKAEITDDALVKYHASHKRLTEALDKLKLENMQVSEHSARVASTGGGNFQQMMNGMGNTQNESAPTEVSGTMRIELTKLGDMPKDEVCKLIGKVLDAIRDAGAPAGVSQADMQMARMYGRHMQSGTTVKFVLSDLKPLREQSYEKAVADARLRGDRLARLSGVKLAGVAAVQETAVPGDFPDQNRNPYYWGWNDMNENSGERDEIVVDTWSEIPVTVRLSVRFEIAEGTAAPSGTTPADAGTKSADVSANDAAGTKVTGAKVVAQ